MLLYLSHYPLPANTGLCTVLYDIAIRRAKCVKKLFKESSCLRTPARAQLILSLYGGAHLAEWPLSPYSAGQIACSQLDRLLDLSWTSGVLQHSCGGRQVWAPGEPRTTNIVYVCSDSLSHFMAVQQCLPYS